MDFKVYDKSAFTKRQNWNVGKIKCVIKTIEQEHDLLMASVYDCEMLDELKTQLEYIAEELKKLRYQEYRTYLEGGE